METKKKPRERDRNTNHNRCRIQLWSKRISSERESVRAFNGDPPGSESDCSHKNWMVYLFRFRFSFFLFFLFLFFSFFHSSAMFFLFHFIFFNFLFASHMRRAHTHYIYILHWSWVNKESSQINRRKWATQTRCENQQYQKEKKNVRNVVKEMKKNEKLTLRAFEKRRRRWRKI